MTGRYPGAVTAERWQFYARVRAVEDGAPACNLKGPDSARCVLEPDHRDDWHESLGADRFGGGKYAMWEHQIVKRSAVEDASSRHRAAMKRLAQATHPGSQEVPMAEPRSEIQPPTEREQRLIDAILDIDAHADAWGEDDDGFVTGGYFITIGSLHRALGVVGHTAPKCRDCGGHDQHELRDANYGMWNAMQRAANHPERWQEFIGPALDRWRVVAKADQSGRSGDAP